MTGLEKAEHEYELGRQIDELIDAFEEKTGVRVKKVLTDSLNTTWSANRSSWLRLTTEVIIEERTSK